MRRQIIFLLLAAFIAFTTPVLAQVGLPWPGPGTSASGGGGFTNFLVWTDDSAHVNTASRLVWTDYGAHVE